MLHLQPRVAQATDDLEVVFRHHQGHGHDDRAGELRGHILEHLPCELAPQGMILEIAFVQRGRHDLAKCKSQRFRVQHETAWQAAMQLEGRLRFAHPERPIDPDDHGNTSSADYTATQMSDPSFRIVLFDMDGTLLEPINDGLPEYKALWGIPKDQLVLKNLHRLPPEARTQFLALEERVARDSTVRPGARALLDDLRDAGIITALITNNSQASWQTVKTKHGLEVDIALARDHGEQKPSPELIFKALEQFNLEPHQAVFVGDNHFDVDASRAAGVPVCLLLAEPWNLSFEVQEDAFTSRRVVGMEGVRDALEALGVPVSARASAFD